MSDLNMKELQELEDIIQMRESTDPLAKTEDKIQFRDVAPPMFPDNQFKMNNSPCS